MRSNKRYKALDETAVMGSICRHEFPMRFINLLHGERFACMNQCCKLSPQTLDQHRIGYAVYMMECLQKIYPNHQINLLYDIACTLHRHLQVYNSTC